MPATPSSRKLHHRSGVLEKRDRGGRHFVLRVSRPPSFPCPQPGAFVHLRIPAGDRFFLRRPFSILGCDEESIELLLLEKGEGTKALRRVSPGTEIDFLGPLGKPFPRTAGRVMGVAGGVGIAPLYFYGTGPWGWETGEYLLVYGARNADGLVRSLLTWPASGVMFATEDGSYGFGGSAVEAARAAVAEFRPDVVFSCGPLGMLIALVGLEEFEGIEHYVSLENRMACGLGACRSCVVPLKGSDRPYATVCSEGPVFESSTIDWKKMDRLAI